MQATAAQIWEAINKDPKFMTEMPAGSPQNAAIRPFVEASVTVLEGQLNKPVTLQSIANAKSAFLRYCIDNNLATVVGKILGVDADLFNGMFEQLIEMLAPLLADMGAFLSENGVTEEQVMLSTQIGMSDENQKKWQAGTLTMGELLLTQPSVILRND